MGLEEHQALAFKILHMLSGSNKIGKLHMNRTAAAMLC